MQTILPASNQVFAREVDRVTQTNSGFLLTEGAAEKLTAATAINVGSKIDWIQPNDQIAYKPYAATEIKLNGADYILIEDADILGIIKEVDEDSSDS